LKVAGLIKHSLIDYPGKIAAVVFMQGCNFRCGFCHNPDLLDLTQPAVIPQDVVMDFLNKRKGIIEGVVLTGGEPTIQKDLVEFAKEIKKMGYDIKLDTNGSDPAILEMMIQEKQVDYVAMDIKGSLEKYKEICAYLNTKVIQESINILLKDNIDYEFRTTLLPYFHSEEDIVQISKLIQGARLYTLQGFRSDITFDKSLNKERSFSHEELDRFASILRPSVKRVRILDNL
jgi:pyruvate formate lyase activating enzyme